MPTPIDTRYYTPLRRVLDMRRTPASVELKVDDALLRIDILRNDLIRLKITRNGVFDEHPTHALAPSQPTASSRFEVVETAGAIEILTARMRLVVDRMPFSIDAYRADGGVIFQTSTGEDECGAYAFLNDSFLVTRKNQREDSILGLGEKTGRLNRNGRRFTLWNTDVLDPNAAADFASQYESDDPRSDKTSTEFDPYYISIPFFMHLSAETGEAAGFFFDNGYRGHFDFENPTRYRIQFDGGQYTEYIFAGPSLRGILTAYSDLTGHMQAPPIWALGYHQCRWKAYTQDAVLGLAESLRAHGVPCDSLWLDIEYMDGYRVFTWNTERFPDAPGMFELLREQSLRVITIIDPGVKAEPGYAVYESGLARGAFCKTEDGNHYIGQVWPGKTVFPDFVRDEARRWWGDLNAKHVESGLAGIWNDMNEPATGDVPPDAMRFDNGRSSHARYHNQYALLMAMATQDGLLSAMPELRTFILSRAGSPGIQRYAANWMGDNMSRWDHLALSVPMALGLGLSGQPFVGADIGGFAENTTPELFARWVQCAAFTPFCRNHNHLGQSDQYPWSFGDTVRDICRASLELRYRLMPALYSAFIQASETGLPIQRPLVLDYQQDLATRDIDDQFLLGDNLLIAPIYEQGQTSRHIYLPAGTWHHWFTGETIVGPKFVIADAPMDYIPVYAKGGSVIPLWPEAPPSTMGYYPRSIELHLFTPEQDGEFQSFLQEDDGLTFAHRNAACYRSAITVRRTGRTLSLDVVTTGSGYPEFRRNSFTLILHGPSPAAVRIDDLPVAPTSNTLTIPITAQPFRVDFDL